MSSSLHARVVEFCRTSTIVIAIVIGTIVLSFAAPLVGALRGMTISIRPVVESHWESFEAGAFQLSIAERWLG